MYRKCVTEVSAEHQKKIESSLLDMMEKMPYEEITVTALCQAAGVTRRVFYHLFGGKTDALHALIDHRILELESFRPDEKWQTLRMFLYWKEQKQLLDVLRRNRLDGLLLERMIDNVMKEDYDVRYWLQIRSREQEQDMVIFCVAGSMGLIYRWYYSDFQESPEEMAGLLEHIMAVPLSGNIKE